MGGSDFPTLQTLCFLSFGEDVRKEILSLIKEGVMPVPNFKLVIFEKLNKSLQIFPKMGDSGFELVSGFVQAGKTTEILGYIWKSIYIQKRKVILLLRNIKADLYQFDERIRLFNNSISQEGLSGDTYSLKYSKSFNLQPPNIVENLIIGIANPTQIRNILTHISKKPTHEYNLCIDEVDYTVKSKEKTTSLELLLEQLKEKTSHIMGFTATCFSSLWVDDPVCVHQLKPPDNYYGLKDIRYCPLFSGSHKIPEEDINIPLIYSDLNGREFILLHTTVTYILHQLKLFLFLSKSYPSYSLILYNGRGIKVKIPSIFKEDLVIPKGTKVKRSVFSNIYHFKQSSISTVLQILKNSRVPKKIVIISGILASRGISFVSQDFGWHLTDQYYDSGGNGETILQGMRILGCYSDKPLLKLWCSTTLWNEIIKQYLLLKRYVTICSQYHGPARIADLIENIDVDKPKRLLTRRRVLGSHEWKITKKGTHTLTNK